MSTPFIQFTASFLRNMIPRSVKQQKTIQSQLCAPVLHWSLSHFSLWFLRKETPSVKPSKGACCNQGFYINPGVSMFQSHFQLPGISGPYLGVNYDFANSRLPLDMP